MDLRNIQVYDAYLELIADLDMWAAQVDKFPLDELAAVNGRIKLTGRYVRGHEVTPMDQDRIAGHAALIQAVRAFATARAQIAAEQAALAAG